MSDIGLQGQFLNGIPLNALNPTYDNLDRLRSPRSRFTLPRDDMLPVQPGFCPFEPRSGAAIWFGRLAARSTDKAFLNRLGSPRSRFTLPRDDMLPVQPGFCPFEPPGFCPFEPRSGAAILALRLRQLSIPTGSDRRGRASRSLAMTCFPCSQAFVLLSHAAARQSGLAGWRRVPRTRRFSTGSDRRGRASRSLAMTGGCDSAPRGLTLGIFR